MILAVSSCAMQGDRPETYLLARSAVPDPDDGIVVCNRAGCEETATVVLSANDWQRIEQLLRPTAGTSEIERRQIARVIGFMEYLTGVQAGTADDQPGGRGVFRTTRQLDCVAETNNTTAYLVLLEHRGLLAWHRAGYPRHRGLLTLQAPHNTAVLIDNDTGIRYAVDAYFHANGQAPEIVPLELWSRGYVPEHY